MKTKLLALPLLCTVLASAMPVNAQITQVSKWTNTAAGKTYVYVPMTEPEIQLSHIVPSSKSYTANACGIVAIKSTETSRVNSVIGNGVNFNSAEEMPTAPTCSSGVSNIDSYPIGSLVFVGKPATDGSILRDYYVKTGPGVFTFDIALAKTAKVKNNGCNFGRVTVSETRPLNTFFFNGTQYGLASLPTLNAPDLCRSAFTGGPKIRYVPAQ